MAALETSLNAGVLTSMAEGTAFASSHEANVATLRAKMEASRLLHELPTPESELDAAVDVLAAQLAAAPTVALNHMKRNLTALSDGVSLAAMLDLEAARVVRSAQTADHREAAKAFVEKRAPRFTGQ